MKRTLTVIVLALAALALLVGAALKSRSIPLTTHVAEYTLAADIERLADDFETLVVSLETAWQTGQAPGEAANALLQRIVGSLATLERSIADYPGSAPQRERIAGSFASLQRTLTRVDDLAATLLAQLTAYSESLEFLRGQGAEVVRQLGVAGLTLDAAEVFRMLAETIEFAAPDGTASDDDIRRLLTAVNRSLGVDPSLPAATRPLLEAVTTVVDSRDGIRSRLTELGGIALAEDANALGQAASTAYQSAVSSAETARTMLSVYAIVMLLSVAVIGFRLRNSYQDLNRANAELGLLNESLEQRVAERTEDLSNALAELRESQVQLVQAEKMSSLGQLVAGISHEINTPLLYLANNASMIQKRIGVLNDYVRRSATTLTLSPADFDDRTEYQNQLIEGLRTLKILLREHELEASAEEIADLNRDSIEGLTDLTDMAQSLKDFSRLDRAPVDSFDVNAGIDKTLTIARNIVKHKAEIRKFYGDIPTIECSPSKINQVFLNLITNAAQAIDDQGEIVIATRLRDSGHVIVSITDNGCGIPAENLAKIRDPFFTTKEVGTGTGLGLSIVDEIIRSHGGELLVESTVGSGSTFSVVLPVHQDGARQHPDHDGNGDDGDDSDAVAELAEAV